MSRWYVGPQLVGALRTDLRDADAMRIREKAKARYNVRIVHMVTNNILCRAMVQELQDART